MTDIIWHDDDTMPAGARLVLVEIHGWTLLCEVLPDGLYDTCGGDRVSWASVLRWAVVRGAE